ncbi:MAG: hypothetical protein V8R80_05050 [Eubacterium sp.]
MEYRQFIGFEDVYPEVISGTNEWLYGQWTPCSEPCEVPGYDNNYPGTRLYIFNIDGTVYEPFMLVKHEIHDDSVNFIWPFRKCLHFEEHESLDFIDGETLITSKWIEDPNYREEVLWRRLSNGEIFVI